MELVFEAKVKKMLVKISGVSYEMRIPKMHETKALRTKLNTTNPEDDVDVYTDFFISLGLDKEAFKEFDSIDFIEFISFVIFPDSKKN